jgi:hypothetical protein
MSEHDMDGPVLEMLDAVERIAQPSEAPDVLVRGLMQGAQARQSATAPKRRGHKKGVGATPQTAGNTR